MKPQNSIEVGYVDCDEQQAALLEIENEAASITQHVAALQDRIGLLLRDDVPAVQGAVTDAFEALKRRIETLGSDVHDEFAKLYFPC